MIGSVKLTFHFNDLLVSYLPDLGLHAANILALAFNVACIPAFEIDIVCCSIASCIAVIS